MKIRRSLRTACRRRDRGFGLIELAISIVVLTVLMAGAFKLVLSQERTTGNTMKKGMLSAQALALQSDIEKNLRNLGYNPRLIQYDTTFSNTLGWKNRTGFVRTDSNFFFYSSDDNNQVYEIPPSVTPDQQGEIQPGERYGYWIVDDISDLAGVTSDTLLTSIPAHTDFAAWVDTNSASALPCTRGSPTSPFNSPKILAKFKKDESTWSGDPDDLGAATAPTLRPTIATAIVDNVVCFEVRYSRRGPTGDPVTVVVTPNPAGAIDDSEFERLRSIDRIQIGIVLIAKNAVSRGDQIDPLSEDNRPTETIQIDIRLPNVSWTPNIASLQDGDGDPLLIPGT